MTDGLITCAPLVRRGGHTEGVLTLQLDHGPASVWAALTEPQHLVNWLAPGQVEPRLGGCVKLQFDQSGIGIDSTVTAFTPERLLEYSWSSPGEPQRPVRWSLMPDGAGTELTLTLQIPQAEDAARGCAGWAAHLEMLAAALEDVPIKFPFESFKAQRDAYRAQLAPA